MPDVPATQFDILSSYADKGVLGLTIAGLIGLLIWTGRRWMLALDAKDELNEKHREELVKFAIVGEGVKHALEINAEHLKVTNDLLREYVRERARS